ncbi:hypothetical protein LINPERPRIM_LOCUS29676 [Linum perenne]
MGIEKLGFCSLSVLSASQWSLPAPRRLLPPAMSPATITTLPSLNESSHASVLSHIRTRSGRHDAAPPTSDPMNFFPARHISDIYHREVEAWNNEHNDIA